VVGGRWRATGPIVAAGIKTESDEIRQKLLGLFATSILRGTRHLPLATLNLAANSSGGLQVNGSAGAARFGRLFRCS
jgi:hypothetical protein